MNRKDLFGLHGFDGAEIVAMVIKVNIVGIKYEPHIVLVHGPHNTVGSFNTANTALAQAHQLEA